MTTATAVEPAVAPTAAPVAAPVVYPIGATPAEVAAAPVLADRIIAGLMFVARDAGDELSTLPDPDMEPRPAERDRLELQRRQLAGVSGLVSTHANALRRAMSEVRKARAGIGLWNRIARRAVAAINALPIPHGERGNPAIPEARAKLIAALWFGDAFTVTDRSVGRTMGGTVYDAIVAEGGDPNTIKVRSYYAGTTTVTVDRQGNRRRTHEDGTLDRARKSLTEVLTNLNVHFPQIYDAYPAETAANSTVDLAAIAADETVPVPPFDS